MKKFLIATFAVLCGTVALIYVGGVVLFSSKYLPGTSICGIDASLKTPDEVSELLHEKMNNFMMKVSNGDIEDMVSGEEVGLSYEIADNSDELNDLLENQDKYRWFLQHTSTTDSEVTVDMDTLKATVPKLQCISSDQIISSENAYIDYQDGDYVIVDEVYGNELNQKKFIKQLKKHFLALDKTYEATCYLKPKVKSDSPKLTKQIEAYKKVVDNTITISNQYHEVTLTSDDLRSMVSLEKGEAVLDEDALKTYISDNISSTFYSVGAERTVTTIGSGTFTISGGTYGYIVDSDATFELLKSAILAGEETTIEPAYSRSETYSYNGGLGNTYIDVNVAEQTVWLVYLGEVIIKTDCVTGNVSAGNDTPKGIYWIEYKREDYQMNEYGNGVIVKRWMCISNETGVGLHDASWRSEFGGDIYETDGSHGCVNLPTKAAKNIYNNCFCTMPVVVH